MAKKKPAAARPLARSRQPRRKLAERLAVFPVLDRFTVSGHLVGDICFSCECRVATLGGEEGMTLAWCECEWPADAHEMEFV